MAHELGMHLHDVMGWPGPMTHRQYGAWNNWLLREMNHPNRTEHYLMQIAAEVRRSYVKDPNKVEDKIFKIPFKMPSPKSTTTPLTAEEASKLSKSKWLAIVGLDSSGQSSQG